MWMERSLAAGGGVPALEWAVWAALSDLLGRAAASLQTERSEPSRAQGHPQPPEIPTPGSYK